MATAPIDQPLLLQCLPDARRALWPLLPPAALAYLALMLGAAPAALCALYNAVALRRPRPAALAIVVGVVGWVGFGVVFGLLVAAGLKPVALAVLFARIVNVGLGVLLAWSQWAHARGHGFLKGRMLPLLPIVLAAFAAVMLLPHRLWLLLQGLWFLLL